MAPIPNFGYNTTITPELFNTLTMLPVNAVNTVYLSPDQKTAKQLRKQHQDNQEAKSFNEKVLKVLSRSRKAKFLKK